MNTTTVVVVGASIALYVEDATGLDDDAEDTEELQI